MNYRTLTNTLPLCMLFSISLVAQTPAALTDGHTATSAIITTNVPRVIRVTTTSRPVNGIATSPVEGATLAIYRDEVGGSPLWQETLNMSLDAEGHYTAMIGSTSKEGVPMELFTSGEPRWLGVQFNRAGEAEQPRVLLASVPYALKAVDAETLGGRPASAYLLAPAAGTAADSATPAAVPSMVKGGVKTAPLVSSGNAGYIGQFVNSTDLGNSMMFNSGGFLGVNNTAPSYFVDMAGPGGRFSALRVGNATNDTRIRIESNTSASLGLKNGLNGLYGWMGVTPGGDYQFSDQQGNAIATIMQTGNVGIGTASPISKLDVSGDLNFSGRLMFEGNPVMKVAPAVNGPFGNSLGLGVAAVQNVTTGIYNTGVGWGALLGTTTTSSNTAVGYAVLNTNTGARNTAVGATSMQLANTGNDNTAIGSASLYSNSGGVGNTASGSNALAANTNGSNNTAAGFNALSSNTTGSANIAIGYNAAVNVSAGNSNNIHLGNSGFAGDNGVTRIGTPGQQSAFFAAGIRGATTGNNDAIAVVIDSTGQLGTVSSSRRFKEDIHDMGDASSNLMRLRPVTYRYKKPYADGSKPVQYGLIAEEVAEVYPELIAHSADGQIETVKYQVLDSMLLNEVQRQENTIQKLERQLSEQQEQNRLLLERLSRLESVVTALAPDLGDNKRR